jgi:hypothetical protein
VLLAELRVVESQSAATGARFAFFCPLRLPRPFQPIVLWSHDRLAMAAYTHCMQFVQAAQKNIDNISLREGIARN